MTIKNFENQIVVVTGGASGIGKSCVKRLAAKGATVVIVDRDIDPAVTLASEVDGHAYELDISDTQAIEEIAERIEREVGPVRLLVANAGVIQSKVLQPEQLTLDEWDRIFSVDLRGTYQCCVSFGKRMAVLGSGAIVNIASIAGMRSSPLHAYSVAKAGVLQMTTNLAVEWGRSGVRVNAVSPGYTLTPVIEDAIRHKLRDPSVMNDMSALGRMVLPEEIASVVAFLLSNEASAVTGVNVPVDAGWLAAGSWHTYDGVPSSRNAPQQHGTDGHP